MPKMSPNINQNRHKFDLKSTTSCTMGLMCSQGAPKSHRDIDFCRHNGSRWPRRVLIRAHWLPKGIPRASCWWVWVPKVSSRGPFWHPKDTFWPSRWYPWASKARFRHISDFLSLFGRLFAVFYRHFKPWQASNNSRAWHDMLEVCVLFEKSRPSENTGNYNIILTFSHLGRIDVPWEYCSNAVWFSLPLWFTI